MHIRELNNKAICILGFGREGQAAIDAIEEFAPGAEVTIADIDEQIQAPSKKIWLQVGTGYLQNLEKFDVIIRSPGIPPCPELEAVKGKVTNSTQIFLDTVSEEGSTVIGVTGTKGKSTTASLISLILKEAGEDVHLVGNIGVPVLNFLKQAKKDTYFVQEMSSAQLMDLTTSPPIAVITSFFPEHLDYHGTLENYKKAKRHIAEFQKSGDSVYYNAQSKDAEKMALYSKGGKMPFDANDSLISQEEMHIRGEHNLMNIAAACKVAKHFHIDDATIKKALTSFEGLPHRLEHLGTHDDLEWVDDAISTIPQAAIAALKALDGKVETIILGGKDRGQDFTELATEIINGNIKTVILHGENSDRIRAALDGAGYDGKIENTDDMKEVISAAKKHTTPHAIVLLSPASASYDKYKDFEEKGKKFAALIR